MPNHRLVYSSDGGDHRRRAEAPKPTGAKGPQLPNDGVARVFREKGGRGGKTVTVIRGLDGDLTAVAKVKRHCATGGAVKDGAIEIQGDHRERVVIGGLPPSELCGSALVTASASFRVILYLRPVAALPDPRTMVEEGRAARARMRRIGRAIRGGGAG